MGDVARDVIHADLRGARLQHFRALVATRVKAHGLDSDVVNVDRRLAPSQRLAVELGLFPRPALEELASAVALVAALWAGQVPAGWTAVVQCAACGQVPAPPELVGPVARCPWCPPRESGRTAPLVRATEGVT